MNEQLRKEAIALLHALSRKAAEVTTLEEFNRVSHLYTLALRRLARRSGKKRYHYMVDTFWLDGKKIEIIADGYK